MMRRGLTVFCCAALVLAVACDEEGPDDDQAEEVEQSIDQGDNPSEEVGNDNQGEQTERADNADLDQEIELAVEPVTEVTWEEIDDAFRYVFERDGEEIGTGVGGSRYFAGHESFDDVEVTAETMDDETVGQTEITSTEQEEHLVLRWNEDAFDNLYIGMETDRGTVVESTSEMPWITTVDPDELDLFVVGDEIVDDDPRVSAPFEFDGGTLVEHGPYTEVSIPE